MTTTLYGVRKCRKILDSQTKSKALPSYYGIWLLFCAKIDSVVMIDVLKMLACFKETIDCAAAIFYWLFLYLLMLLLCLLRACGYYYEKQAIATL